MSDKQSNTQTNTIYEQLEITDAENSRVGIKAAISWDHFAPYYEKALDAATKTAKLDGFRPGHAPRDAVEAQVGQMNILQDAAQAVLGDAYPAIVTDNKIRIIGYPQISITKIAHGEELGFFISTDVMPEVTLPDYKSIAADHMKTDLDVQVTDEDVDGQLKQIQEMYAHTMQQGEEKTEGASEDKAEETGEEEAGEETKDKIDQSDKKADKKTVEITDEFVQKLGDYKTVDDFKTQLRADILKQKETQARDKRREDIMSDIADKTEITLPEAVIAAEQDKMLAQIKDDISRMGMEFEAWLEHQKKTEEDVKKEIEPDARKRATVDWLLKEIGRDAGISADQEKVDAQVETLTTQHPDAPLENIRAYVENIYINEAVIDFLESQKA